MEDNTSSMNLANRSSVEFGFFQSRDHDLEITIASDKSS